jgi:hypothetical protein
MYVRALLAIVAFCALASVALVRASDVWASLMFSGALGVISLALLAAILRRGAKQAFWIGFTLFGWLYLWMAHWRSDPDVQFGPNVISWRMQQDESGSLATTKFLVYVYNEWLPKVRETPASTQAPSYVPGTAVAGGYGGTSPYGGLVPPGGAFGGPGAGGGAMVVATPPAIINYPALHEFTRVGHTLFTIILAFVGGVVATYFYKTRDAADRQADTITVLGPSKPVVERPSPPQ